MHEFSKGAGRVSARIVRGYPKATDDIGQRLRVNYSQWRSKAWYEGQNAKKAVARKKKIEAAPKPLTQGQHLRHLSAQMNIPRSIETGRQNKAAQRAMVDGVNNINRRRADRHLP